MKKVLILTVIAIMALGVFALANSNSVGPTCATSTLSVTSNIYVLAGFEATATAYDATFCGATGNLLDGTVLSDGNIVTFDSNTFSGIALAQLKMKSNHQTIKVTAVASITDNNNSYVTDSFPTLSNSLIFSGDGTYTTSDNVWELPAGSSAYTGTGYLVYNSTTIQPWIEAGKYTMHITFTITPATLYSDGTFSF